VTHHDSVSAVLIHMCSVVAIFIIKNPGTSIVHILMVNLIIFSDEVYQCFKNKLPKIFYLKISARYFFRNNILLNSYFDYFVVDIETRKINDPFHYKRESLLINFRNNCVSCYAFVVSLYIHMSIMTTICYLFSF
jgi:hypothetical protein